MNKKVISIALAVIIILFIGFQIVSKKNDTASSDEQIVVSPTPDYSDTPTETPTISTTASLKPASPEDGIDNAVSKITQALQAPNASQFQPLLIDDMVLGNESGGAQETNKANVISWLNNHWSNNLQYVSKHYTEHFGSWDIETSGWSNIPSGTVTLKLFRYDVNGQRQAFSGDWKIFAVLY